MVTNICSDFFFFNERDVSFIFYKNELVDIIEKVKRLPTKMGENIYKSYVR